MRPESGARSWSGWGLCSPLYCFSAALPRGRPSGTASGLRGGQAVEARMGGGSRGMALDWPASRLPTARLRNCHHKPPAGWREVDLWQAFGPSPSCTDAPDRWAGFNDSMVVIACMQVPLRPATGGMAIMHPAIAIRRNATRRPLNSTNALATPHSRLEGERAPSLPPTGMLSELAQTATRHAAGRASCEESKRWRERMAKTHAR